MQKISKIGNQYSEILDKVAQFGPDKKNNFFKDIADQVIPQSAYDASDPSKQNFGVAVDGSEYPKIKNLLPQIKKSLREIGFNPSYIKAFMGDDARAYLVYDGPTPVIKAELLFEKLIRDLGINVEFGGD